MAKEDTLEFPGVVKELLPNATFRVELKTAMRSSHIRQENAQEPDQGSGRDKVEVEMTPYDLTKGALITGSNKS